MSYFTANKIFNLYCDKLINLNNSSLSKKYRYSDLNGYDIIDISNAMKLLAAFRVYNTYLLDQKKRAEIENYAVQDASGLHNYFFHFFPDEDYDKLIHVYIDNEKEVIEYSNLANYILNSETYHLFSEQESPQSFLKFCIELGRSDPNFWGKVYERIGISWETNDNKDPIYVLIKHGVNFETKKNQFDESQTSNRENKPFEQPKNLFKRIIEKFIK